MDVRFEDSDLERVEREANFTAKLSPALVKAFRKRMQMVRAAHDERDFYAMKSLHYEQLKDKSLNVQKSVRENVQLHFLRQGLQEFLQVHLR